MAEDIKNRLEQYILREQALLNHLSSQLTRQGNAGKEIGNTIISEGVAAFAANLFESSSAGKLGRKLAKAALDRKQKDQALLERSNIESQHDYLVREAKGFISSVSFRRKSLREPNSYCLVEKLDRAQECQKVETRIKKNYRNAQRHSPQTAYLQ